MENVSTGDITDGIISSSTVEAERQVEIYSRVTGIVTELNVEEGDRVRKGELLCVLEDEELTLNEAKAKAEVEKLAKDLELTKSLLSQGVSTEKDLINLQHDLDQAQINWRQAKANLEYSRIKATIDGIIYERSVQLGRKITPNEKLFSLFDPGSLVIHVYIPENDYFRKISGRTDTVTAQITSDSLPGEEFNGSILRVAPVVDPATNTLKITLTYKDPRGILKPGMYVKVRLVVDTHENAVLIPKSAILFDNNIQYVFVVRDGKAVRVPLDIGYTESMFVESKQGIEPGEKVVVVGQSGLKDDMKVHIVED